MLLSYSEMCCDRMRRDDQNEMGSVHGCFIVVAGSNRKAAAPGGVFVLAPKLVFSSPAQRSFHQYMRMRRANFRENIVNWGAGPRIFSRTVKAVLQRKG